MYNALLTGMMDPTLRRKVYSYDDLTALSTTVVCVDLYDREHKLCVPPQLALLYRRTCLDVLWKFYIQVLESERAYGAELLHEADKVKRRTMNFWG